jgi:hypothetical protein
MFRPAKTTQREKFFAVAKIYSNVFLKSNQLCIVGAKTSIGTSRSMEKLRFHVMAKDIFHFYR